jgi:hypothetical protein
MEAGLSAMTSLVELVFSVSYRQPQSSPIASEVVADAPLAATFASPTRCQRCRSSSSNLPTSLGGAREKNCYQLSAGLLGLPHQSQIPNRLAHEQRVYNTLTGKEKITLDASAAELTRWECADATALTVIARNPSIAWRDAHTGIKEPARLVRQIALN